jgi:hypothetical protein
MEIFEAQYEDRAQYVVETQGATWWLDRAGGGFSRLIDPDGADWIAFHKDPLSQFPQSAAAGFRGIPNCLFGETHPDAGGGHPGFDRCQSAVSGGQSILTETTSGRWAWRWDFTEEITTLTMEKADPEHSWWVLYEGPVGGRYEPQKTFWATDTLPEFQRAIPDIGDQLYGHWRWACFGHDESRFALFLARHAPDAGTDNLWFLGNESGGAADSQDGMLVFGMGRGPRSAPLLRGAGQRFTIGFLEKDTCAAIAAQIEERLV